MKRFSRSCIATAVSLLLLGSLPWAGATSVAAPGAASLVTRDKDNLWNLAAAHERGARLTRQQWMLAVLRRNPEAFVQGNMHRLLTGATLQLPTEEEAARESQAVAEALIEQHDQALGTAQQMPPPRPLAAADTRAPAVPPAAPPSSPPAPPVAAAPGTAPGPAQPSAPSATAPSAPGPASPAAPIAPLAPASAPAAAEAPPRTAPAAPVISPAVPVAGAPSTPSNWLPQALAVGLASLALLLLWQARRRGMALGQTVQTLFQDTIQLVGKSRPKVVAVSQAGADMARSVEQLASTAQLVRADESPALEPARRASAAQDEALIKLDIARAQLEIGRRDAAVAMLKAVLREGSERERQAAQQLLVQLGAA
ncbi:MAG: hypothetical protein JNJ71_13660 [Rubrivivax sp.]|nr:hypothetical protein [Rubrivivax sp.]